MKPLIYGYMRVGDDASDDQIDQAERTLREYADVEGFCYATTFYDDDSGSRSAFYELTAELQRAEARHVIVPSLDHLSRHPILLNHMIERLEHEASARIWVAEQ
ncbi:recombinase family protein [Micromonospora sp. Llam7]|uniref:recombinase family protein n=1 Tax=Micromonospora tarapacensis TaxID=2835305 RepID=UPI001C837158|nr:recombinase family protein [Micromonospora tarapacensis]MBX7268809.1 recombinase family protein [Micromonospora tarapacensis]